jgi:hypothetical protein
MEPAAMTRAMLFMPRIIFVIAAALAFAATLPAVPASAQSSIRTYVSTTGTDNGTCGITAPCRHFQAAVNATSLGGEVDALEPGGYGSFTISHAVTIEGQGWSYVAPPANGAAITVTVPTTDTVYIHGVSLNGVGVTSADGILFNLGGTLNVRDSVIRNFSHDGIEFAANASGGPSQIFVSNTVVSDNGNVGIDLGNNITSGTITGVLDHVQIDNNGFGENGLGGVQVQSPVQTIELLISNSNVGNSSYQGVLVGGGGSAYSNVVLKNVTINQTPTGVLLDGNAAVYFSQVAILSNGFPSTTGVQFSGASNNSGSGDGTSHLGTLGNGVTIGTWGPLN